ncbi:VWA domain-containing protein [Thiomonas sp.]
MAAARQKQIGGKTFKAGPLTLIAKAIGRKYKVQVVISDRVTVPHTDGKVICLPGLRIDGSPEDVAKLNAFLDHESGHVRFSDFSVLAGCTPLERILSNVIEDPRIEALMESKYPGCRYNFEACLELEVRDLTEDRAKQPDGPEEPPHPASVLCTALLSQLFVKLLDRKLLQAHAQERWTEAEQLFGKDLMAQVYAIAERGATAANTIDVMTATREIIELLKLPNPQAMEIQVEMAGFRPHGVEDGESEAGQGAGQGKGKASPSREKGKGRGVENETTAEKSGKGLEQGDPEPGGGSGTAEGEKPETGEEADGDEQGQDDCESGDQPGKAEGAGDLPGGTGAGNSGTHRGDEAIQSVLDVGAQDAAEIGDDLDRGRRMAESLADSARDGHTATDSQIQPTQWRGSPAMVEILRMDGITRPLRIRLEDVLQSRQMESYYPVRNGFRTRRRSIGLYGTGLDHFFQKREEVEQLDSEFMVSFDMSGSMSSGSRMTNAKIATIAVGDSLMGFDGVKFQVSAFDTMVFTFHSDWRQARQQIAGIPPRGGTRYGPALLHGIGLLQASEATRRVFVLVTDGDPSDAEESSAIVRYARQLGIEAYGLSIEARLSDNMRQIFGAHAGSIGRPQELPAVLGNLIEANL